MTLQEPESMAECVYFTNRSIEDGAAMAWVSKENCPKCKKALMGKPKDPKTGRPKIRAKEYVCPECNYTVDSKEYEETLTMSVKYTCPKCKNKGEIQIPFKRKKVQIKDKEGNKKTIDSVRFQCQKCNENIDISKKMK